MPAAIPLVAGLAGAYVGGAAIAFGTITWGTIYGGIASMAASFAMGAIARESAPDLSAALSQSGAGRTQQIRQPTSPLTIPYGRVKTSGPILFAHTTSVPGGINSHLYIIHAFAGTQINGIDDIYLGDDLSSLSQYGVESGITITRFGKHLGSVVQTVDGDFVSEIGAVWTSNHRLRGIAYLASRLYFSVNAFGGTGIPNISAIINGVDTIYDPRTETTGFTNNAALCIADFLTAAYGMNLVWSKLDEPSVIAAANVCDERVPVIQNTATFTADATTNALTRAAGARVLDWGDGIRVSSSTTLPAGLSAATTYYVIPYIDGTIRLATSVANAFAGIAIDITSSGSGTHTLTYYDEARYKCNGVFTLDAQQNDILEQLLTSMAGVVVLVGGKWFVHAGHASTPTITLSADDLSGDLAVSPKRSKRDRFNGVQAVFVNPDKNWQPTDAKPRLDAGYLAEDGDEERYDDVRFNFTTSERCVQRLMNVHLQRNRRQRTVQAPFKLTAMRLMPWDGVYLDIERGDGSYLLEDSQHRVIGWKIDEECRVQLDLQEDDSAIWDWTIADEDPGNPQGKPNLPDPHVVDAPDALTVETPGITWVSLFVEWTAEEGANFIGYDVEYRVSGGSAWVPHGRIARGQEANARIIRAVPTDFRVRNVNIGEVVSDWTQNIAPSVPTSVSSPAPGELQWTNGSGADFVSMFKDGVFFDSETVGASPQTRTALPAGSYQIRSKNSTGNVSDLSATVVVSDPGGGTDSGDDAGDGAGDGGGDDSDDGGDDGDA